MQKKITKIDEMILNQDADGNMNNVVDVGLAVAVDNTTAAVPAVNVPEAAAALVDNGKDSTIILTDDSLEVDNDVKTVLYIESLGVKSIDMSDRAIGSFGKIRKFLQFFKLKCLKLVQLMFSQIRCNMFKTFDSRY